MKFITILLALILCLSLVACGSIGLKFAQNDDGKTYQVVDYTGNKSEVTIPKSYMGRPVTSIGGCAFSECTSITSITIPDSVTSINYAFYNCSSLTNITIPDSVTSIGYRAFYECESLTSITIPDSVTSIDDYAFYECESLTDINFNGSKEQWNNIEKHYAWNSGTGNYTVHCTDGDIAKQ